MKNKFFRLGLAIISLVTLLSLLAACGEEISSNITNTPAQTNSNTPTATGAASTVTVTTVAATTSASVTTTVALPTVTLQPATTPATTAAPTTTAVPVVTTAPATTAAPTNEPTASPTTRTATTKPVTSAPATAKPAVTTTAPVKVTAPGTTPAAPTGPAKLPGKIVFESFSKIYLINPDGTGLKKLADGHSPVFSPDGKRVAFISDDDSDINSVDLNGGALQYHCPTEGHLARIVRWSPSGKYVAVDSQNGDAQGTSEIRLCDMTYKGIGALQTVIRDSNPAKVVFDWSLDEKYILWQSAPYAPNYQPVFDLWYSKPEIGIQQWLPVTDRQYKAELSEGKMYIGARISPTNKTVAVVGTRIFFTSTPGYTSSYNGLVLDQFDLPDAVAWSPDSAALLVSGTYNTDPGLYLYHFDSGKVTRLTQYITSGYVDWTRK